MSKYMFIEIGKHRQNYREENKTFKVRGNPFVPKEKRKYVLDIFSSPSSQGLYIGYPEGYVDTDMHCPYMCMAGFPVLHPDEIINELGTIDQMVIFINEV